MKFTIDTELQTLVYEEGGTQHTIGLYSPQSFALLSHLWTKVGWNERYSYRFSWMGRPIIQLPEDVIRVQEAIYQVQPDVIIETGVAHGGSLIFYASLLKAMGRGHVVGIDIEIRPTNRQAIEAHPLTSLITLIEGSSTDPTVIASAREMIGSNDTVMVILDSNHSKAHVLAELEAYCGLVTPHSYIVATDGVMQDLYDVPHGDPSWCEDNPTAAALEFVAHHPEFVLAAPRRPFMESLVDTDVTYWPGAWLRRVA